MDNATEMAIHVGFQLSQRLLGLLVDKKVLTPIEAAELLTPMIEANQKGGPANRAAAGLYKQMADQFRRGKAH